MNVFSWAMWRVSTMFSENRMSFLLDPVYKQTDYLLNADENITSLTDWAHFKAQLKQSSRAPHYIVTFWSS